MNTSQTPCKAKNPEFCRYHSSRGSFNERAESTYNSLKEKYEKAVSIEDRYYYEESLKEAEQEYAATDAGREYFAKLYDETDDPVEKEHLKTLMDDGEKLRDYVESKADGVIRFPASKLEEAEKRIAAANRRLERAGIQERFTYETEEYVDVDPDGHAFQMVALSISHPKLNVAGWDFVASVDKTDDGSVVTRVLPSQELHGYRPDEFKCDHCGSNRRRNSTYLVRNKEGEFKQVGSNCLQSFLGVKPQGLWALDYDPDQDGEFIGGGHRSWGSADTVLPTTEVVAAALAVSEGGDKYVSNSSAREWGLNSTSSDIRDYFFSHKRVRNDRFEGVDHHQYVQQAKELMAATSFDGDDDYNTNMRTLVNQEWTSYKHIGYVASVVAAHKRQHAAAERAAKEQASKAVGYLGKPGEKIKNVKLKVTKKFEYMNNYERTTTLLIMEDELGRQVKWSASGYKSYGEGDEITISGATIKNTDTYNGNEQTVITRARVVEE